MVLETKQLAAATELAVNLSSGLNQCSQHDEPHMQLTKFTHFIHVLAVGRLMAGEIKPSGISQEKRNSKQTISGIFEQKQVNQSASTVNAVQQLWLVTEQEREISFLMCSHCVTLTCQYGPNLC